MKGKPKSRWNDKTDSCEHENGSWCKLPKHKRCKDCLRCTDGSKACEMTIC